MRRQHLLSATAALTALLALGGCRKPEITTYTAPKDPAPAITGPAMSAANLPPSTTAAPAIRWQLPAGWTDQGANNIRLGNILVTGPDNQRAEMTVTRFEGTVGGDLANVNRWRNQLQLPPIDEAALSAAIVHRDYPAGHMDAVDLVSDTPLGNSTHKTRTLVAWLPQADATWFFKLTGDDALVASQRDAFSSFLASVEFSAAPATSIPSGPLPDGHPPITSGSGVSTSPAPSSPSMSGAPASGPMTMANSTLPASAVSSGTALIWSAPSSWTEKPLGPIRKGSFAVGDADLAITAFPGEVGGLLANLNRWRGELQLEFLTPADLPTATVTVPSADPSLKFLVVDMAGNPGAPTRTLGAILPVGSDTYFFKLKGPDATVAAAKNDFLAFLATVKSR
ncbi:hypothetical protein CMV30_02180 [Nibricoccus aquaticus]|uniref:Uncharacterized protein n=1 Tax=Nibricoccus aquaticus TaxID=2576891 RepID=A0A290Q2X9_9BACT|nr:hypothetical protein [Nibricoccus aquaticus]ATC62864.1 hypothetical protein CMV30_02180 [Nibricoccus aquaticus]